MIVLHPDSYINQTWEFILQKALTASYRAQCTMIFQIGEGDEFRDIDLVSTAGFLVGDVE